MNTINFDALTSVQKKALAEIAIGINPRFNKSGLMALEDRGLIEATHYFRSGRLMRTIKHYSMPAHVHKAWNEWRDRKKSIQIGRPVIVKEYSTKDQINDFLSQLMMVNNLQEVNDISGGIGKISVRMELRNADSSVNA